MRLFLGLLGLISSAWGLCPHEDGTFDLWSDPATWEDGKIPIDNQTVIVDRPILLDTVTSHLNRVFVTNEGRLVFQPGLEQSVMLIARNILISNGGALLIGGPEEECRFKEEAEIILWGMRDDFYDIEGYGQKFLVVEEGGTFEVYGPERTSWTRLMKSVVPNEKVYEFHTNKKYWLSVMVEIDASTGERIREQHKIGNIGQVQTFMDAVQSGNVVWFCKWGDLPLKDWELQAESISAYFEDFLGQPSDTLELNNITHHWDGYSLLIDTASMAFVDDLDVWEGDDDTDGVSPDELSLQVNDLTYRVHYVNNRRVRGIANSLDIEVVGPDFEDYTLELEDDVSDWQTGDMIVLASTDYNFEQAERFKIVSVDGNEVTIKGRVEYTHYSDVYEGMEMRGEVGHLTRNIKIHGDIEDHCYNPVENQCDIFDHDNFGGHMMFLYGFDRVNIVGAEIFHMGQSTLLAKYPIHFHMCHDTMRDGQPPMVRNNAIHDTFSRCVTIHGSHNVHVIDNVAVDHYGHCYFTEDGGEKYTWFEHNLGLGTRKGVLTQSDNNPTTFWIVSPLTTMLYNSAAGSDYYHGVGIWYLFPDEPVSLSTGLFFKRLEAKHTPILDCKHNTAHSNGHRGFAFQNRLGPDHNIIGCSTYSPRVNSSDLRSEFQAVTVEGYTGYKNRMFNLVMRSTAADLVGIKLADSRFGAFLIRNMDGGYQRLKDAIIIGESPNVGKSRSGISYKDADGKRHYVRDYPRSVPIPWALQIPVAGVKIESDGPTHLENVKFLNFRHNEYRWASAIVWADAYNLHNGVTTSAKGLQFDYQDPDEGFYIYDENIQDGRFDFSIAMRDIDGSLTGIAGSTVMKTDTYFTESHSCELREAWNLQVCQEEFVKFMIWPAKEPSTVTFLTDSNNEVQFRETPQHSRLAYYLYEGQDTMILNYETSMPDRPSIRMQGMEQNHTIILGICLPRQASNWDRCLGELVYMDVKVKEADTMEEFMNNEKFNLFFDREKTILYRRFQEKRERGETELGDCMGGLHYNYCPHVQLLLTRVKDVDLEDGNCQDRF